jgi:hypothetical protein
MAQTPPLPAHIPPPVDDDSAAGPASGQGAGAAPSPAGAGAISAKLVGQDGAISAKLAGQAASMPSASAPGSSGPEQTPDDQGAGPVGLPRRQVAPPAERPPSMAAAAQALAGNRPTQPPSTQPAESSTAMQSSGAQLAPPVIPGASGVGRSMTGSPVVPAAAARPPVPPTTPASAGQPQPADSAAQAQPAPPVPQSRPDQQPAAPETTSAGAGSGSGDGGSADQVSTSAGSSVSGGSSSGGGPGGGGPGSSGPGSGGPGGSGSTAGYSGSGYDEDFVPANAVEQDLHHAVDEGSTDSFLSTLLLASVLVPVAPNSRPGSAPGESGFAFRTEEIDGDRFLVVFTSRDRLAEHFAEPTRTVGVRFVDLIRNWPDPAWSFAVNPTSPIGARYPGPQVIALASWAVEAGLGGDPVDAPVAPPPLPAAEPNAQLTTMQKAVPAEQVDYYLERGYDRVAGFVHRAGEVEHLRAPGELFAALGLLYDGSPYQADAKEAFVLRWPAHRPSLYRIPYGGQSEQALRAMDGWVIERPPFRGNGFAPGEGKDVIAEFKVDSVRLPHGAQLWRMDADGAEQMIAVFDCDAPVWRRVGEQ